MFTQYIEKQGQRRMFLIESLDSLIETVSKYWGYAVSFVLALGVFWRATRKTGATGKNIFTVIRRFTDTGAALNQLTETVKKGFDDVRAEQAYLNAKLEVLSDGHITPTFRADELGNFVDVNEAFCQLFHKTLDELEGDGWTSIFTRDDRTDSLAAWDRAISRKINFAQTFRVVCAGRISRTVKMRARPIFDGRGEFKEFVGSISVLETECETSDIHTSATGRAKLSDAETGKKYWKDRELKQ